MAVRLNITMDEDICARLKQEVPPRKISTFHLLRRAGETSSGHQDP
ncbi:MAG: hypothetical protein Nkreftii_001145 [Candidatus Nitrospira kreftii]|uniref:Uncharacterized protein n=1 Tax=Candidatus Nitrospira kreftii TaxID=2652173 RepID=A0A7S8FCN4_9BACT|nr:MAG: hypothetical protein Nkreftii_001145 [Candidatus Nitrospira kreftii]